MQSVHAIAIGLLAAMTVPACARAAPCEPHADAVPVSRLIWSKKPTPKDLAHLIPAPDHTDGPQYGGHVGVDCVVTRTGWLRACHVTETGEPHLDKAAVHLMSFFQVNMRATCVRAGQHVVVPINFKLD